MGGGTFLVSLPKEWAKKNGITKGSLLGLEEVSPRKIIIGPVENTRKEVRDAVIGYTQANVDEIVNDLTGKYLLGYDIIRIESRSLIERHGRAKLKEAARRLIGLEIVDEDSKKITFQFLLEERGLEPEKLVRRMAKITEGMLRDIMDGCSTLDKSLFQAVGERDDELDRLYFLLVRTLRSASVRPDVLESYGLTITELLDYRVLASYLENIGDASNNLAGWLERIDEREFIEKIARCMEQILIMHERSIMLFLLARKKEYQRASYEEINKISKQLSIQIEEIAEKSEGRKESVEVLSTLLRLSNIFVDIADLTIPSE